MAAQADRPPAPEFVEASLKYLADDKEVAPYVPSIAGGPIPADDGNYATHRVTIRNGRIGADGFSLDREGFTLAAHSSVAGDFYDDAEIAATYENEVVALVLEATGANRVDIFDHTRRSPSTDLREARMMREPASIVHNDYTAGSAPRRLRDHFADAPAEAEALLERRFAIVNVWRSMRGPVRTAPLAFCEAASVALDDLVAVERRAPDRIGEVQSAVFNPAHLWTYFPEMTMDEAALIKTYDSATDGRARFALHTSFDDPTATADAPPRESIETRCFVFF
jgi:hypothetical protein